MAACSSGHGRYGLSVNSRWDGRLLAAVPVDVDGRAPPGGNLTSAHVEPRLGRVHRQNPTSVTASRATSPAVEMDDAALGLACTGLTDPRPWFNARNASDPRMNGATFATEKNQAAAIYEKYG